jgi:L-threonylcarbamoyladenylate synthase
MQRPMTNREPSSSLPIGDDLIGTDIQLAARHLAAGRLIGLPTETVYGLGADARNPQAIADIFTAKGRPSHHPLIVHIADTSLLHQWAIDVPDIALQLAATFWPGPLTMILKKHPDVPPAVTGCQSTIGVRIPAHPMALQLLAAFHNGVGGIAAPSANRFGAVSPTTAAHVKHELGMAVSYILDGGACQVGVESTIVDVSGVGDGLPISLLRPGGVTREQLQLIVGDVSAPRQDSPVVSGSLVSHYAPNARVIAVPRSELNALIALLVGSDRAAVIAPASWLASAPANPYVTNCPLSDDIRVAAQQLYGALRDLDDAGFELIIAALPAAVGIGEAIVDRVTKAAAPRPPHIDPQASPNKKDHTR